MSATKMFKVLTPVENEKTKKTYWVKLGIAFVNRDSSINVHCDAWPVNGKLQLREWDEEDRREGAGARGSAPPMYGVPPEQPSLANETTPF